MERFKLSDAVRDVLRRSEIDRTTLKLPGELDRKLYVQVDKAIKACGGRWDRKLGLHVFTSDPRVALGIAIESGEMRNAKQAMQTFFTPPTLAALMAANAELPTSGVLRVLEPSAGDGALIRALLSHAKEAAPKLDVQITAIELDTEHLGSLRALGKNVAVHCADFLKWNEACQQTFDLVMMNPPFRRSIDLKHLLRALRMLRDGGLFLAICSNSNKTLQGIMPHVEHCEGTHTVLPAGTFKPSGTNVVTNYVRFRKRP